MSAETSVFTRRPPDAAGHGIGLALGRDLAEAHLLTPRRSATATMSIAK